MVTETMAEELAQKENLEFFEASAKTGKNVEEVFVRMAEIVLQEKENFKKQVDGQTIVLRPESDKMKKKSSPKCCK